MDFRHLEHDVKGAGQINQKHADMELTKKVAELSREFESLCDEQLAMFRDMEKLLVEGHDGPFVVGFNTPVQAETNYVPVWVTAYGRDERNTLYVVLDDFPEESARALVDDAVRGLADEGCKVHVESLCTVDAVALCLAMLKRIAGIGNV